MSPVAPAAVCRLLKLTRLLFELASFAWLQIVCGCFQAAAAVNSIEVNQWDHAGRRETLAFRLLFTQLDAQSQIYTHLISSVFSNYLRAITRDTFISTNEVHLLRNEFGIMTVNICILLCKFFMHLTCHRANKFYKNPIIMITYQQL